MLKVGFGQADITPAVEGSFIGSVQRKPITGVHDPLLAVACVIDDGVTPLALVGIDSGVIQRETADAAQQLIAQQTGIPRDNVIISASHTHQGGPVMTLFYAEADPAYVQRVARGIATAVVDAWNARRESAIGSGFGRVAGIHFNRRFLMRDGREVTHPGKLNPQIVRPAGPIDEKVNVLAARDLAGEITGLVVHFGCHCTTTEDGTEFSADYVHYLRQHLIHKFPRATVVFLLGACGDITQIDNQSATIEKGHAHADFMGQTLASGVAGAIAQIEWKADVACRTTRQSVSIPIREGDACPPPAIGLGRGELWEKIYRHEAEQLATIRAATPAVDCAVHAVSLGDLAIVTNGAELFCQPALNIQQASPFAQTWVVTLTNEYRGYVPTATAMYAGGYEPRTARSSFLAINAAQVLVQTSLAALAQIKA
jgi:hypothetical protein